MIYPFHETFDAKNTYVVADLHISHRNIVFGESSWLDKSCCRNFNSTQEMNYAIISSCKTTLNNDSILFLLGDVLFGDKNSLDGWLDQIPYRELHYIYGNHCDFIRKDKGLQNLFTSCHEYLEIYGRGGLDKKKLFCLFHYPLKTWRDSHKGSFILSGHVHGTLPYSKNERGLDMDWNIHRKPMSLFEIDKILSKVDFKKLEN